MAFWGIEVKPGKSYTHTLDDEQGRLHISQATLGTGSSTKKSIVQCNVGGKRPIYLCSLLPERIETCPLNLEFEEEDEVTFSVIGPHSVHLSGFFSGDSQDNYGDDYGPDSYEENIVETDSESEESTDTEDDEDEYDFIDDDVDMFQPSPVPNSGVIIEEIFDDEKPAKENGMSKRPMKNNKLSVSDDNNDSQHQIVVNGGTGVPILESEDEDGFPISSPGKGNRGVLNTKEKEEEINDKITYEEPKKKKAKDDRSRIKSVKRKVDAIVQDGDQARETGQAFDSSVPTAEVVPENDGKQRKEKKKKVRGKEEKALAVGSGSKSDVLPDEGTTRDMDQALAAGKENIQKLTSERSLDSVADGNCSKEKKKKNKKKNKKQESAVDANTKQTVTEKNGVTMEVEERAEAKSFQARSFSNGLGIEELEMGKPDGKRASPGKKVSVKYIGKLKKNGKIFDSNISGPPFKFRLGIGEVIKGWDVGVNGMRVGDKRRLTIPPAMGYGAQGAGAAIPPNSWLVFDVQLVDVS